MRPNMVLERDLLRGFLSFSFSSDGRLCDSEEIFGSAPSLYFDLYILRGMLENIGGEDERRDLPTIADHADTFAFCLAIEPSAFLEILLAAYGLRIAETCFS